MMTVWSTLKEDGDQGTETRREEEAERETYDVVLVFVLGSSAVVDSVGLGYLLDLTATA